MATTGRLTAESFDLPFQGAEPGSRQCSYDGAKAASERVGRQCLALLTLYREHGPLIDAEAAAGLGVERSTINARRAELVKRGLVKRYYNIKNETTGIMNSAWGLSTATT